MPCPPSYEEQRQSQWDIAARLAKEFFDALMVARALIEELTPLAEGGDSLGIGAPWQALINELLKGPMTEEWGWGGTLKAGPETELGEPKKDAQVHLFGGGLTQPYFSSTGIDIDFGVRRVHCVAIDQKTPAEERWTLTPDNSWWDRAQQVSWPLASSANAAPHAPTPKHALSPALKKKIRALMGTTPQLQTWEYVDWFNDESKSALLPKRAKQAEAQRRQMEELLCETRTVLVVLADSIESIPEPLKGRLDDAIAGHLEHRLADQEQQVKNLEYLGKTELAQICRDVPQERLLRDRECLAEWALEQETPERKQTE